LFAIARNCWLLKQPGQLRLSFAAALVGSEFQIAGVAELADALDSKSSGRKAVWVRAPPPAILRQYLRRGGFNINCNERVCIGAKKNEREKPCTLRFYACMAKGKPQCSFVNGKNGHEGAGGPREFVTTRWSLILSAANLGDEEQKARQALADLCRTYWRPIFLFVRARGCSIEDAQDLTQDFFVTILRDNWLQHADRNRGRFRSLLLRSLQNFLINAAEKTHAHKRGGGVEFISWDDWMAEAPSQLSISVQALDSLPPDRIFDLTWATTVVEHAFQRLREECESKGKLWLFQALSSYLTDERDELSYPNLSTELGITEVAVKKQLHNMRQRYRSLLRDEVSQTVEDPADVDDEIRYLCAVLATGTE
jgi:DNA-directed RNA polymerase specialized sigma24 family protein